MMYVLWFLFGGMCGALIVCVCVSAKGKSDRR